MRILYDYQIMQNQKYGGVSRYFSQLADGISNTAGIEIIVPLKKTQNYYFSDYCEPNIKKATRWHVLINCIETFKKYRQYCKCKKQIDIIHPTYFYPSYLYIFPSMWKKSKLVITVHDLICEKFDNKFDGANIRRRRQIIEKADGIIVVSQNTKKDLLEEYPKVDPGKVYVVYHGIDMDYMKLTEKVSLEHPYILFVGTRIAYKNAERYMKALSIIANKVSGIDFVFVGGAFTPTEEELISSLGIKERVIQKSVNDEQLHFLYQNALCFVFPSLYEGFGIPIIEAFACGCPVLLSNSSCFPEIAGDAALYFDGESVEDMTERIIEVINNTSLRKELIEKGKNRVKDFTVNQTISNTIKVYEQIIKNNS